MDISKYSFDDDRKTEKQKSFWECSNFSGQCNTKYLPNDQSYDHSHYFLDGGECATKCSEKFRNNEFRFYEIFKFLTPLEAYYALGLNIYPRYLKNEISKDILKSLQFPPLQNRIAIMKMIISNQLLLPLIRQETKGEDRKEEKNENKIWMKEWTSQFFEHLFSIRNDDFFKQIIIVYSMLFEFIASPTKSIKLQKQIHDILEEYLIIAKNIPTPLFKNFVELTDLFRMIIKNYSYPTKMIMKLFDELFPTCDSKERFLPYADRKRSMMLTSFNLNEKVVNRFLSLFSEEYHEYQKLKEGHAGQQIFLDTYKNKRYRNFVDYILSMTLFHDSHADSDLQTIKSECLNVLDFWKLVTSDQAIKIFNEMEMETETETKTKNEIKITNEEKNLLQNYNFMTRMNINQIFSHLGEFGTEELNSLDENKNMYPRHDDANYDYDLNEKVVFETLLAVYNNLNSISKVWHHKINPINSGLMQELFENSFLPFLLDAILTGEISFSDFIENVKNVDKYKRLLELYQHENVDHKYDERILLLQYLISI